MGIDCATSTGLARWDTDRHESSITCQTIKATGGFDEEKAGNLGAAFVRNVKQYGKPDIVVMEAPLKASVRGNVGPTIVLNQLAGALMTPIALYGCRFEIISSASWRTAVYGFGKKKGWSSKEWKKHAKAQCEMMGIQVANADEAEAAMICFYAGRISKLVKMAKLEAA
jgi:hypothetical protein